MSDIGKVTQLNGAVVDVTFKDGHLPEIMNALENLNDSINDSIMSKFEIEKNFIGDPLSFPGNFATVYQGKYNDKIFALKIFTQKKV